MAIAGVARVMSMVGPIPHYGGSNGIAHQIANQMHYTPHHWMLLDGTLSHPEQVKRD